MSGAGAGGRETGGVAVLGLGRGRWVAALVVALAHLGLLGLMMPSSRASSAAEPVSVTLEREADSQSEAAEAVAEAPPPALPEPAEPPVSAPVLPVIAAPELAPREPAPVVVPKPAPPKPVQKTRPLAKREPPKVAPQARRQPEKTPVAERPRLAPVAREGKAEGSTRPAAAARAGAGGQDAGYAARVRAALQARANALGFEDVNATVVLSFSIDAAGRVNSASVARPSGDFKVDGALRRMLASASFPPPPGGRFSATVPVRIR